MAEPLLDFLTGRARAALPFLRKAAAAGVSASNAIDVLRAFGAGFNTQKFNDLYTLLQGQRDVDRIVRLIGENTPFPPELATLAPFDIANNFEYVVAPAFSRGVQEDYLTVVSDVPLSPASIRQLGAELGTEGGESDIEAGMLAPENMIIIEVWKAQT